jgi:hypothetical protein
MGSAKYLEDLSIPWDNFEYKAYESNMASLNILDVMPFCCICERISLDQVLCIH